MNSRRPHRKRKAEIKPREPKRHRARLKFNPKWLVDAVCLEVPGSRAMNLESKLGWSSQDLTSMLEADVSQGPGGKSMSFGLILEAAV